MDLGRGGVKRRSHHITGNAASPASIQGEMKLREVSKLGITISHSLPPSGP